MIQSRAGSRAIPPAVGSRTGSLFAQASAWAKPLLRPTGLRRVIGICWGSAIVLAVVLGTGVALADEPPIAAVVNGVPITMAAVDRAVDEKVPRISGHGTISPGRRTVLRAEVIEDMIAEELMVQEAKRQELKATASAIDDEVAKVKKRFPDSARYAQVLARNGMSEEGVRRGIEIGRASCRERV